MTSTPDSRLHRYTAALVLALTALLAFAAVAARAAEATADEARVTVTLLRWPYT
jgi:hypothetical protein